MHNETPQCHVKFVRRLTFFPLVLILIAIGSTAVQAAETFTLNKQPVIKRGSLGGWTSLFVDPGAVVFHNEKFHMLFNALPSFTDPVAIGYTSSENAVEWTKESTTPVLTAADTGFEYESIMASSAVVTDNGQWVLYFTLIYPNRIFEGAIARATATSPNGPWKVDPKPVLEPGSEGTWDSQYISNASVVKTDNGYRMYYTGTGSYLADGFKESHENVGMAISSDGITWQKYNDSTTQDRLHKESDPVFYISEDKDAWDSWNISDTNVQKTPNGWTMLYRGSSFSSSAAVGLATSKDGINWKRAADEPLHSASDFGGGAITITAYLHHNGQDFVFIEAGPPEANSDIYLSTR